MSVKENILCAACKIAETEGIMALTVDNIIEKSGASKGGFFYHFKTKEDMIMQLLSNLTERFEEELETKIGEGLSFTDAFIKVSLREVSENNPLMSAMIVAVAINKELGAYVKDKKKMWHERMVLDGLSHEQACLVRLILDGLLLSCTLNINDYDTQKLQAIWEMINKVIKG